MSTPSTITAVYQPHHFYQQFPEYHTSSKGYQQYNASLPSLPRVSHNSHTAKNSAPDLRQIATTAAKQSQQDEAMNRHHLALDMRSLNGPERRTDWNEFYKNGIPKEVIVIDDDSPDPPRRQSPRIQATARTMTSNGSVQHMDKRRRTDTNTAYDPIYHAGTYHDSSKSNSTNSTVRTTSALYSTAPTSLESSSGSQRAQQFEDVHTGQKRKRPTQRTTEEVPELDIFGHKDAYQSYKPPPKPPIKASDVYVHVVRDKTHNNGEIVDDEDGHYVVVANSELTERYKITKLLGQGTFGKVVEAVDRKRGMKCAVKIIRAVPKYRDASRIELRVLATLASNDKHNRNKCIHLRDCFDFRNHICIVTDLLGQSVFDFLKANAFTPFPSTHIQSFARQLFTSVAFLHDLNLIHTDLKPENILLVSNSYQTFTYNRTIPTATRNAPRTAKHRKVLLDPEIRLIDFGSATFDDEYHSSVVSTRHYRAPEIILNLGWSFPCDIWSIGCILVEFFTGDALFQTHDNLEHLAMMEAVCNTKFEPETVRQVKSSGRGSTKNSAAAYFKPRALALNYPNEETPKPSRKYVRNMKTLDETIIPNNSFNTKFLDLLRRIFVYDPCRRITAKQALQHPWFRETMQDDGTEALKIRLERQAASGGFR